MYTRLAAQRGLHSLGRVANQAVPGVLLPDHSQPSFSSHDLSQMMQAANYNYAAHNYAPMSSVFSPSPFSDHTSESQINFDRQYQRLQSLLASQPQPVLPEGYTDHFSQIPQGYFPGKELVQEKPQAKQPVRHDASVPVVSLSTSPRTLAEAMNEQKRELDQFKTHTYAGIGISAVVSAVTSIALPVMTGGLAALSPWNFGLSLAATAAFGYMNYSGIQNKEKQYQQFKRERDQLVAHEGKSAHLIGESEANQKIVQAKIRANARRMGMNV